MNDEDAIRDVVLRIRDAWVNGPPEAIPAAMDGCFADDVVMRGPEFQLLGSDRETCIRGYIDFLRQAQVLDYRQQPPQIDLRGDTAVAISAWEMTYQLGQERYSETGHELLVLAKQAGRWMVVWRTVLSRPAA